MQNSERMDKSENIKQILISELGKPTKQEQEQIIADSNLTFIKNEIPQLINQKKSKAFFATTTTILTFAIIGLLGYNFYQAGSSLNLLYVLIACIILAATAGYEWAGLNKKTVIYRVLEVLNETDTPGPEE